MADKLGDAIYYLVSKVGCIESRTKLVKLLYLADNLAKDKIGRTITGIRYVYHFYGPYSHDIIFKAVEMDSRGEIVEDYDPFYDRYIYYKGNVERRIELSDDEIKILDVVIEKYGKLRLDDILKEAYNTERMKRAKPGDIILE